MLSIHICRYNCNWWAYCDGDCENCRAYATGNVTTSSNGLCTAICQYKSWSGYCSLTACPYRSFAINPISVEQGNKFIFDTKGNKPIKVKARKLRRKR